jgi:hypothetical protein
MSGAAHLGRRARSDFFGASDPVKSGAPEADWSSVLRALGMRSSTLIGGHHVALTGRRRDRQRDADPSDSFARFGHVKVSGAPERLARAERGVLSHAASDGRAAASSRG